ncbi:MAG: hypothetical protein ACOC0P_00890, partial [Planctomycetota bacterium]
QDGRRADWVVPVVPVRDPVALVVPPVGCPVGPTGSQEECRHIVGLDDTSRQGTAGLRDAGT